VSVDKRIKLFSPIEASRRIVGFEVLTAATMKMAVFLVVAPSSLVEIYRRFISTCSLIALMMEAARTSERSVIFYQTIRSYKREDSHQQKEYPKINIPHAHLCDRG
jgi:hypothetical protein